MISQFTIHLYLVMIFNFIWTVITQNESTFHHRSILNRSVEPAVDTPLLRVSHLYPGAKVIDFGGNAIGLNPGEGEAFDFREYPYRMKLGAKQTNGNMMIMEGTLMPGE
ncbi:unnamed protein product, partial [Rotaria sp. Silwood1]